MRTSSLLHRIAFDLFTILVLLAFFVAGARTVNAQCPSQTVENAAGECVFNTNKTLTSTLILESNTTLNCQGHKLLAVPDPDFPGHSKPEVAIFLNGVQNVKIKNCKIHNFDFGIFAINGKRDPGGAIPSIQILNNKGIVARFVGISLMSVDDSVIRGNSMAVTAKGGRGIYVGRDSDGNQIRNNTITGRIPSDDLTPVFRAPGLQALPSNPVMGSAEVGSAVLITQIENLEPSLLSAVITDTSAQHELCGKPKCLFQIPIDKGAISNENPLFSKKNIVKGNIIHFKPGFFAQDGIVLAVPQETRVSNNKVTGAKSSIRVGIQNRGTQKQFHGTCMAKTGRFCLGDTDCNIDDIDPPAGTDTCQNTITKTVFWVSRGTTIENNFVQWPFELGIVSAGDGTIISGNTIGRASLITRANPGAGTGIRLNGLFALEGSATPIPFTPTIVSGNTVKNLAVALFLSRTVGVNSASEFRAKISSNDFIGNDLAVGTSNDYNLINGNTDLSVSSRGNFWGTRCPIGLAPTKVRPPNPKITDQHPFGFSVVKNPLQAPCF